MDRIMLELRTGEGGADAKLLLADMKDIYIKTAKINNFSYNLVEEKEGFISIYL